MLQNDLFDAPAPSAAAAAPFFNTCELAGAPLAQAKRKAGEQCQRVLEVFRRIPGAKHTPSQVWKLGQADDSPPWLLTSVRRAMTTLTDAGALRKLDEMRDGPYGKPEHLWQEVRP